MAFGEDRLPGLGFRHLTTQAEFAVRQCGVQAFQPARADPVQGGEFGVVDAVQ